MFGGYRRRAGTVDFTDAGKAYFFAVGLFRQYNAPADFVETANTIGLPRYAILRDGDPGEPEQALGGFGSTYYQHAVEIEFVEEGDAAARDAVFDALLQQIGAALEADETLGGLIFGLTYGRPETSIRGGARRAGGQERDAHRRDRLRVRRTARLTT